MSTHGSHQHRRAAKALLRRIPTKVHVLEERFSPTAVFPGMGDHTGFPPFFPPNRGHGPPNAPDTTSTPEPLVVPLTPTTSTPTPPPTISSTSTISSTPTTSTTLATSSSSTSSSVVPTTITSHTTASRSSATPSPSSTPPASSSSGVSTGAIVGGIGAGIVAIAAIGFAVAYFVRRVRKRKTDEAAGFDARDFRRSAVMLQDPPTHEDTVARGYNPPPPPSMMEQRQHHPASAPSWGYPESSSGQGSAGHGTFGQYQEQYASYPPGQVFGFNSPPPTATTAQPLLPAPVAQHTHNPITPTSSLPSPYEPPTIAPVLTRQTSNNSTETHITVQSSAMARQVAAAPHSSPGRKTSTQGGQIPADDYVDLDRSSISPFQAVQYAEISRRLNAQTVAVPAPSSAAQLYATQQKDLPPVPPPRAPQEVSVPPGPSVSPFSDPDPANPVSVHPGSVQSAPASPEVEPTPDPEPISIPPPAAVATPPAAIIPPGTPSSPPPSTLNVQTLHIPGLSSDSLSQELEFPVPPSPALSYSSRYRVESLPPTLPEIKVQQRSSVSSYIPGSPMIGTGYISGISEMTGFSGASGVNSMGLQPVGPRSDGKFVPTPSPLASSFAVASPARGQESVFAEAQKKVGQTVSSRATTAQTADSTGSKDRKRHTIYDDDDAYGGI